MAKKDRKYYRDKVSQFIKTGAVDAALAYLFGAFALLNKGPIKWFTEKLVSYLWDKTADKIIRGAMRKGWLVVDLANGHLRIKKINKAKNENDDDEYWRTISNI